uniref:Pen11 n=1 Tax=Penicillium steckii TaxID=303698 RepID=A0A7T1X3L8_9EURO|nr:Pen11 [Penicillium steckii]
MNADYSDYQLNLQSTPADGSILPHLLLFGVQMIALIAPPFHHRKTLLASSIVILAIVSNINRFTDDPGLAQFFSLAWPHYLSILEKVLGAPYPGPETTLWRIDRPPYEALQLTSFGPRKLIWAFVIWFNLRGIRWNYQVQNIPAEHVPGNSKWRFLLDRFLTFIRLLLMADLLGNLAAFNFYSGDEVNSRLLTVRHDRFVCQLYRTASVGMIPYTFMNLQYVGGAILWVLFGFSQPADWPPFFGRLAQVTSVRAFWGKFWHQMIRRVFIPISHTLPTTNLANDSFRRSMFTLDLRVTCSIYQPG